MYYSKVSARFCNFQPTSKKIIILHLIRFLDPFIARAIFICVIAGIIINQNKAVVFPDNLMKLNMCWHRKMINTRGSVFIHFSKIILKVSFFCEMYRTTFNKHMYLISMFSTHFYVVLI